MRLEEIRKAERESHEEVYSSCKLYESGSWLQKPIRTVLNLIPEFAEHEEIRVLDLGGGVGRNCIPFAKEYRDRQCLVECVDILDMAIEKLYENAREHDVESVIKGIVSPIEKFDIKENAYDLIMAISALEHIDSEESFINKLQEIRRGIRKNGIVCLVINSEVVEIHKETKEALPPQFEVNLSTEAMKKLLEKAFTGWELIKTTVSRQNYDIPRDSCIAELSTNVVTYVARKML